MLIVADDFGISSSVNDAILGSLRVGLVDAASAMVTFPSCEEGVARARDDGYGDRLGLHVVLTEGQPITDRMRRSAYFCNRDGVFDPSWRKRGHQPVLRFTPEDRVVAAEEVRAQISRLREWGVPVSHLDSHHHAHVEPAVAQVLGTVARETGVARVRLCRNIGPDRSAASRAYKALVNAYLRSAGLGGSGSYFGECSDYTYAFGHHWPSQRRLRRRGEVLVHPDLADDGRVVDRYHDWMDLGEHLRHHHLLDGEPPTLE